MMVDGNISRGDAFPSYLPLLYLQKGKTGIARLALHSPHASVVPICIKGARNSWNPVN